MIPVLSLLLLHGLIGGADVVFNHELAEHLPQRNKARIEEGLHSLRELIFALLFGGLAWFEWRGAFAWGIAALLFSELLVSWIDTLLEDRIRTLSPCERSLHVLLFINFGAYVALLAPVLLEWQALPTGLSLVHHGFLTWALSALSALAFAWCIRDAFACITLNRLSATPHILHQ
jgi:hypothetical protein